MKPIRYFNHQDSTWYNVNDYIGLLLEAKVIWPAMPTIRKRFRQPKTPLQTVLERLAKSKSIYQIRVNEDLYVNWVIYENIFRTIKPFLIRRSDWTDPESLFRKILIYINELHDFSGPSEIAQACFVEVKIA